MSANPLHARAEVQKLARLLDVDHESLEAMESLPLDAIVDLRGAISDFLLEVDRRPFARAAAAAKALPTGVIAKIAQHAMGPLLSARVAALLDPADATKLAAHLPPPFLADVAVELDVRYVDELVGGLPSPLLVAAAEELDAREEHVAMSGFVGCLSDERVQPVLDVLTAESLLRAGFLLDPPERLDALVSMMSDRSLTAIIEIAVDDPARWPELLWITDNVGAAQKRRLVDLGEPLGASDSLAAAAKRDKTLRRSAQPLLKLADAA